MFVVLWIAVEIDQMLDLRMHACLLSRCMYHMYDADADARDLLDRIG